MMNGESTRIPSRGGAAARVAGAALGLALAGGPLLAQAPGGGGAAAIAAMKGDLRAIVSANEVYHAHHATYAKSVDSLPGFHTHPGVSITFVSVADHGWSAKATGASAPGKSCVIYVGAVPPPKTEQGLSGPEAVATCDKP